MGVKAIGLKKGDIVIGMEIAQKDKSLALITEKGYGKKTSYEEFKTQNRGGKGLIAYKTTQKTGKVIAAKTVEEKDEIMMITNGGIVIRISQESIKELGRNTQGIILMRMKDDKVVAVAKYVGS